MGTSPLCKNCHRITSARLTPLRQVIGNKWFDPGVRYYFFTEDSTATSVPLTDSEHRFQSLWPRQRLLSDLQVDADGSGQILCSRTLQDFASLGTSSSIACPVCFQLYEAANEFVLSEWVGRVHSKPKIPITTRIPLDFHGVYVLGRNRTGDFLFLQYPLDNSETSISCPSKGTHQTSESAHSTWRELYRCNRNNMHSIYDDTVRLTSITHQKLQLPRYNRPRTEGVHPETLSRLKIWLDICTQSHKKCLPLTSQLNLPTRLLEVSWDNSCLRVRLIETRSIPSARPRPKFAALSHCWGPQGVQVTLKQENHQTWLTHISFSSLPRTFQEAILVTKSLGLGYLWIDALCIIQDSAEDWNREAPTMRDIYAGCHVCLAASGSTDSYGGLLLQNYAKAPFVIRFDCAGPEPLQRWVIGASYTYESHYTAAYWRDVRNAPLNSRSWVFQEAVLPARFIYFTRTQIWWRCQHNIYTEIMYADHIERLRLDSSIATITQPNPSLSVSAEPPSLGFQRSFLAEGKWINLVLDYCGKDLTHERDRLVALAGIAEIFSERQGLSGSDYLAGFWRPDLKHHLLWNESSVRNNRERQTSRPVVYAAPTWSWASKGAGMMSFRFGSKLLWNPGYSIVDAEVTLLGPSSFGAIKSGILTLRCTLVPVTMVNNVEDDWSSIVLDTYPEPTTVMLWDDFVAPETTHCMHVAYTDDKDHDPVFYLLRAVEGSKGTYTRTGCTMGQDFDSSTLVNSAKVKDATEATETIWLSCRTELPESQCRKRIGSGVYEIAVI